VAQLEELCRQARYKHVVHGDWGFDRKLSLGKGLSALFSGPPGTGKTMAAEVIAGDLGLDLYKIDLSQVVSKYIGETEKNMDRLFNEARAGNAILFFDECDALFGKRTTVQDAHDRYANIEIAYLLQKLDEHDGLSILASNLRQNLDAAFTRRLTFIVEFPFPDAGSRRRIWESIWPAQLPRSESLDLDFMATQFKLPGGAVRNIAVAAAFLAAEAQTELTTEHLLWATRRELEKSGRRVSRAEFGSYAERMDAVADARLHA
jgi:SpoVK/Ycf46/Vps4 family AAA+-type ATPase